MYSAICISKYIIHSFNESDCIITNLKLQKILYYIQGYYLRMNSQPLFNDEIVSWKYDPVVPTVYYEFCEYVSTPIDKNYCSDPDILLIKRNTGLAKLINKIIAKCKNLSARELVTMTHNETPWVETKQSNVINEHQIEQYFLSHSPLNLIEA